MRKESRIAVAERIRGRLDFSLKHERAPARGLAYTEDYFRRFFGSRLLPNAATTFAIALFLGASGCSREPANPLNSKLTNNPTLSARSSDPSQIPTNSQRKVVITVMGHVNRPTTRMVSETNMSILSALDAVGGFGRRANRSRLTLIREINGKKHESQIDTQRVLEGKETLLLQDGDVINVPELILPSLPGLLPKPTI